MRLKFFLATILLLAPAAAYAQAYAPVYVNSPYGYSQFGSYGYPVGSGYQLQSRYQQVPYYQNYVPPYYQPYMNSYQPPNYYSSGYPRSYGGAYGYNQYQYPQIGYSPFATAYPVGGTDAFGRPLCQWSDYSGATSCSYDPQQWIRDPYTGQWY